MFCHANLHLLERSACSPQPSQVNIDKIDIEKVKDIPEIPQEERDIYSLLYEELSAPMHETRSVRGAGRGRGRGRGRGGRALPEPEAEPESEAETSSSATGPSSSDDDMDESASDS